MLWFFLDNVFVAFDGEMAQKTWLIMILISYDRHLKIRRFLAAISK